MIKTSLSVDRSHKHGKTLRPTPSIVNIYSIDMTKYQEVLSAESMVDPGSRFFWKNMYPGILRYARQPGDAERSWEAKKLLDGCAGEMTQK
jgi:hypothetical protein